MKRWLHDDVVKRKRRLRGEKGNEGDRESGSERMQEGHENFTQRLRGFETSKTGRRKHSCGSEGKKEKSYGRLNKKAKEVRDVVRGREEKEKK